MFVFQKSLVHRHLLELGISIAEKVEDDHSSLKEINADIKGVFNSCNDTCIEKWVIVSFSFCFHDGHCRMYVRNFSTQRLGSSLVCVSPLSRGFKYYILLILLHCVYFYKRFHKTKAKLLNYNRSITENLIQTAFSYIGMNSRGVFL